MSSITVINGSDTITSSRAVLNANAAALNADKEEVSNKSTDTALSANSDTLYPSQKAVKTYIDTQGGANASETVRGIVEEATDAEVTAGTATGGTGAKLVVTPAKLATLLAGYATTPVYKNGLTSKNLSDASAGQTIAHGLGKAPKRIIFHATYSVNGGGDGGTMHGTWDATSQNCVGLMTKEGAGSAVADADYTNATALKIVEQASITNYQVGTVSVDATNITITWVKTGTAGSTSWNIVWMAEA